MNSYVFPREIAYGPLGIADMIDGNDAPDVKIIPPLVYLAGIIIGFLATIGLPTRVVPNSVAWTVGGILTFCGADLAGSALFKFKDVGTTESWSRKSEQSDKWSFCLTAGTLCPTNQERP